MAVVAVVAVLCGLCASQPDAGPGTSENDGLTPRAREWQEREITGLVAFRPDTATKIIQITEDAPTRASVSYAYGMFWLGPTDWAYMTSISSHDLEPQIALIIDRDGRVYRVFEHVCPSLPLSRPEGLEIDSIEAFLQTYAGTDDEPRRWELLEDFYATADRAQLPTAQEHQRMLALAPEAAADARRLAIRALIRDGTEESWEVVKMALAGITDWAVLEDARQTAHAVDEAKGQYIAGVQQARLNAEPQQRTEQQILAILSVADRTGLDHLLALVDDHDAEALCARIEAFCRSYTMRAAGSRGEFARLRNVVNAFGALDTERAAAFFSNLLESPAGPVRQVGVYGVGELRVPGVVAKLRTMVVAEHEGFLSADSVCVALGKISTPEAHQALIDLLLQDPMEVRLAWAAMAAMTRVCGGLAGSPPGTWANGCWATVADGPVAVAERFAAALNTLADRTADERLAREARGRARSVVSEASKQ